MRPKRLGRSLPTLGEEGSGSLDGVMQFTNGAEALD